MVRWFAIWQLGLECDALGVVDSLTEPINHKTTQAIEWGGGLTLFSSPMVTAESSIVVVPVLVVISSMNAISVLAASELQM